MKIKKNDINILVIACFVIATFTTYLNPVVNYAIILLSVGYFGLQKKYNKYVLWILLFMVLSLVYASLGAGHFDGNTIRGVSYSYLIMFGSSMMPSVIVALDKKNTDKLFWFFIIVLIAGLLASIVIGITNPMAMRKFTFGNIQGSDRLVASSYARMGLINYTTAHTLPIIAAFFMVAVSKCTKKIQKAFFAILMVIVLYVLVRMVVTTALITSIIAIAIIISYRWGKSKIGLKVGIILCLLFLTSINNSNFIENWAETTDNVQLAAKVMSVVETTETGTSQGQVAGRGSLYEKSFDAILKYPIIGGATMSEVGQHSFILDFIAIYGVFCILLLYGWWRLIKNFKDKLQSKFNVYILFCLLPIIMLIALKSMGFMHSYFVATLVILPLCFNWLKYQIES